MSTAPPVPMFSPDGQLRMVPNHLVDAAAKSSGQPAVQIIDPSGKRRYAPKEMVPRLLAAGAKLAPAGEMGTPQKFWLARFLSSAVAPIKGAVQSFSGTPTEEEKKQGLTSIYDVALRPFERVAEAQIGQVDEARDLAKQERYSEAAAHGVASVLPLVGPWVADAAQQYYRQLGEGDVAGALGTAAGNMALALAPEAAREGAPKVGEILKSGTRRIAEAVTGTGPKTVADLIGRTEEANAVAEAKAAEKTAKQQAEHAADVKEVEAKRQVDLKKFFDKTQAAKEENAAKTGAVDRKQAINRGIERLDTEVRGDLEKVEERVDKEANRRYDKLAAKLNSVQADPEFLPNAVVEAAEKIKGSDTEPPILRDMEKKVERGDTLTYEDLQGYRSEIGRELRRRNLPGDIFYAYKGLQDAVTGEMERIAGSQGMGDQFRGARDYYRQYAEAFLDRDAVARKALDSKERGGVAKAYQGKDQSGIEQIARFDPELAQRLNNLRGYKAEANALPSKPGKLSALPKLAPKPAPPEAPVPVKPELKTVGPEDIRKAKADALYGRAGWIRHRGMWAATWPVFYALRDILHGNVGAIPGALAESAGTAAAVHAVANLLEKPSVVDFLTRATPEDIAQVPADLRGNLPAIVRAAQKQGIKVTPALAAVVTGAAAAGQPRKRVAAALKATQ